jgi:hypothetical protein
MQYRQRMANAFRRHSPTWKDVDVSVIYGKGFDVAEAQILADAQREALHPTNIPAGTLIERITTDRSGRQISHFFGDPAAWMDQFKAPVRNVVGFKTGNK